MMTTVSAPRQLPTASLKTSGAVPLSYLKGLHCPGAREFLRPANFRSVLSYAHESLSGALSLHIKCATANERSLFELNLRDLEDKLAAADTAHNGSVATGSSLPAAAYTESYAARNSGVSHLPECSSMLDLNRAFLTDRCPLSAQVESSLTAHHLSAPTTVFADRLGSTISLKKYRSLCKSLKVRFTLSNGFESDAVLWENPESDGDKPSTRTVRADHTARRGKAWATPQPWSVEGFYQLAYERNYCTLSVLLILVNLYALCTRHTQDLVRGTLSAPASARPRTGCWPYSNSAAGPNDALRLHSLPRQLSCFISAGVWLELRKFLETLGLLNGLWHYPDFPTFTRLLRMLLESRYGTDGNGFLVRLARCARCNAAHVEFINTHSATAPHGPGEWYFDEGHSGYRYLNGSNICPVCHCTKSTYIEPNPHDEWVYREL
ncbi:MAG: hypothetical protein IJ228_09030 [Succinivibrio sp.]|nr:hypothetical protein [Succinivibrio sp.]